MSYRKGAIFSDPQSSIKSLTVLGSVDLDGKYHGINKSERGCYAGFFIVIRLYLSYNPMYDMKFKVI